ncbi:MAG: hypothetical protein CME68_06380 [Halobacteriovoraceae bacterium]|nr:hypothetical protein [Halobacteriovoraceae bacterium]
MPQYFCPLCRSPESSLVLKNKKREFYLCSQCSLTFVPSSFHLSKIEEKDRYTKHNNSSDDPIYKEFLMTLTTPLLKKAVSGVSWKGLDFGSGSSDTLSLIMREEGHEFYSYDPFFKNDTSLLETKYDVITCSEAIEHFSNPKLEWEKLWSLLKPNGTLAVMTQFRSFEKKFSDWWYIRDLTHVSFFSKATFDWLADRDHLKSSRYGNSVIFFEKRN